MKCSASVTFEFRMKTPLTHKVAELEAGAPSTMAARALREAKKRLKPASWTSAVIVLERLNQDGTRKRLDDEHTTISASDVSAERA